MAMVVYKWDVNHILGSIKMGTWIITVCMEMGRKCKLYKFRYNTEFMMVKKVLEVKKNF